MSPERPMMAAPSFYLGLILFAHHLDSKVVHELDPATHQRLTARIAPVGDVYAGATGAAGAAVPACAAGAGRAGHSGGAACTTCSTCPAGTTDDAR